MNKVKALPILVPPLALQNKFAAFVEQVDKSEFIARILAILLKKHHNKTIDPLGESADERKGAAT